MSNKDIEEQKKIEEQLEKLLKRKKSVETKIVNNLGKQIMKLNDSVKSVSDLDDWYKKINGEVIDTEIRIGKTIMESDFGIKTVDDFKNWFDKAEKAIKYVEAKKVENEQAKQQQVQNNNMPFNNNNISE